MKLKVYSSEASPTVLFVSGQNCTFSVKIHLQAKQVENIKFFLTTDLTKFGKIMALSGNKPGRTKFLEISTIFQDT